MSQQGESPKKPDPEAEDRAGTDSDSDTGPLDRGPDDAIDPTERSSSESERLRALDALGNFQRRLDEIGKERDKGSS